MNVQHATAALIKIEPVTVVRQLFVRAYNTIVSTHFHREHFFDCTWSYQRGFRYNFRATHPVLYLAADHLVASAEIGARTRQQLLVPHLQDPIDPYLYITVRVTAQLLDLTNAETRDQLGVTLTELLVPTETWTADMDRGVWAATHMIGRLALEDRRFDGILYPPYPATDLLEIEGKQNAAIFMDPAAPAMSRPLGSSVVLEVVDDDGVLGRLGIQV